MSTVQTDERGITPRFGASEELNAQAVHLDGVAAELQLLAGGDTIR